MTTSSPQAAPQQWEIWEVDWLHEDGTSKPRPALVVSSNTFNSGHSGAWVAKISSQYFDTEHRIEIAAGDPSFKSTGLKKSCYVYLANVRLIEPDLLLYRRGRLGSFSALVIAIQLKKAIPKPLP